jgi:hypothetical protein
MPHFVLIYWEEMQTGCCHDPPYNRFSADRARNTNPQSVETHPSLSSPHRELHTAPPPSQSPSSSLMSPGSRKVFVLAQNRLFSDLVAKHPDFRS